MTWTLNPNLILNGISKLLDNEIKTDSKMTIFDFDLKNPEEDIQNNEKNYRHNIIFRDLEPFLMIFRPSFVRFP